jgi:hypothetical protein
MYIIIDYDDSIITVHCAEGKSFIINIIEYNKLIFDITNDGLRAGNVIITPTYAQANGVDYKLNGPELMRLLLIEMDLYLRTDEYVKFRSGKYKIGVAALDKMSGKYDEITVDNPLEYYKRVSKSLLLPDIIFCNIWRDHNSTVEMNPDMIANGMECDKKTIIVHNNGGTLISGKCIITESCYSLDSIVYLCTANKLIHSLITAGYEFNEMIPGEKNPSVRVVDRSIMVWDNKDGEETMIYTGKLSGVTLYTDSLLAKWSTGKWK